MYSRIPTEIKPSETSAKLTYANAFDHEFSLLLRERRPVSLLYMQDAALEVESNILASNRLKKETTQQIYDKKEKKEAAPGGSTSHSAKGRIDEMAKLVNILTAKLNKLELEKNSSKPVPDGEQNPNNQNQFRRQFAPRFMPRERRNNDIQRERRETEDQRVPPPLQNNVADEEEVDDEVIFEDTDQDMNHFGERLSGVLSLRRNL